MRPLLCGFMNLGSSGVLFEAISATRTPTSWLCVSPAADPADAPIDPNGNLTQKTEGSDTWTYAWNAEHQLTKVEENGAELATFAYDPMARRVEKVAAGATTSYTYDALDILRERRGGTTLKYVDDHDLDSPLAIDDGSTSSYVHADAVGTVAKVSNADGAVTLARQYDAWGNLQAGTTDPGYAFTGREWDPETGLHYYRARYYDPSQGRFTSEDPLDFRDGLSRYAYVLDNPVNLVDPSGRTPSGVSVCGSCSPDVTQAAKDACGPGGMTHSDASVRRCLKRKCNPTTKVTCLNGTGPCNQRGNPASTKDMFDSDEVYVCANNPPTPDTCWKRILIHELWIHACNPIDPHVPDPQHEQLKQYIKHTTKCP